MASTNGALAFVWKQFGSSGRTRPYNPSVNRRRAYSRLTLQTQDLDAQKTDLAGIWGDSGGTLLRCFRGQSPTTPSFTRHRR